MNNLFRGLGVAGLMAGVVACQGLGDEATSAGDAQQVAAPGVEAMKNLVVVSLDASHVPTFVKGDFGRIDVSKELRAGKTEQVALRPILASLEPLFHASPEELVFQQAVTDNIGDRHYVYAQHKHGLEVVGGGLVLHSRNDAVYAVHGSARADLDAPRIPGLDVTEAVALARKDTSLVGPLDAGARPRLAYWKTGDALSLVYRVNVAGVREDGAPVDEEVVVDAMHGGIVARASNLQTLKNREIHDLNHDKVLPGPTARVEGGPAVADAVVNTNYNLLGLTYDCYKNLFNRDSYDNAGAKIVSSVHYGTNYANAGWSSTAQQMLYGDGDGVTWGNFANALDVTAHELTHAVINATSNLHYYAEPGALNESMADSMGAVCEWYRDGQVVSANTWKAGEEIWTPGVAGDALRYLNDPKKDGRSFEYYDMTYDTFVEVHLGSGIPNLAFYLLAQGGQHPRARSYTQVTGIGIAKAAQVFYRAITVNLLGNRLAGFAEAKVATEQAAAQLGYSAAEIASVTAAWNAVGVGANAIDHSEFFVRQTYQDVLARAADASGLTYYLNILGSCNGDATCLANYRALIAQGMLESPENQQQDPDLNPASPNYKAAFITHCYTNFLRRQPSASEHSWWMDVLNRTDYRHVVNGFITSQEYRQRFGRQ